MTIAEALPHGATVWPDFVDEAIAAAHAWLTDERAEGTMIGAETLWGEAHHVYTAIADRLPEDQRDGVWACVAAAIVFDTGKVPLNQRTAAHEACGFLVDHGDEPFAEKARHLQSIADRHNVDPWKIRSLLSPGVGCPWLFPRAVWSQAVVVRGLESMLAVFDWADDGGPDAAWLSENAFDRPVSDFLSRLGALADEESPLRRVIDAVASLVVAAEQERKDVGAMETHAFVAALSGHGLFPDDTVGWHERLLLLREAAVLLQTYNLYRRAEGLVRGASELRDREPALARELLERAASVYKRLAVAQMYPERLLERHKQIVRTTEELAAEHGLPDDRPDHVLLVSTYQSPGDLQRLLLSVSHELMDFAYGKQVRVVVSDGSSSAAHAANEGIFEHASRTGLPVSVWDDGRRTAFIQQLNEELFPDGAFDVAKLVGMQRPGEKGIPYGRIRNLLRLAGLVEIRDHGLENPILTWLDQDNELGALVLTRDGTLAKRHVFNYFDQKAEIFRDPTIMVGGGGYTNDALEGVEKFWVAWGILHSAVGLAKEHSPQGPAVLSPAADITRFRPWDQSDTLERLPREGEEVETMSDQFLLLLNTLIGTFRGKYDNQVQIYHPWTQGHVVPGEERLVEELRPFAGMPGGNTSLRTEAVASPIPFITVGGRGEDIFHLWQLEGVHGPGSICLTHTPALHTRNVSAGRGDLMAEIVSSYNGRIFREPPYLWAALSQLFASGPDGVLPGPDVEAETATRIEGLRDEAKANISTVSAFAREIEPYLDGSGRDFWWLSQAEEDERCRALLTTLRGLVQEFKDPTPHIEKAEKQLLGLDEVKELTAEFVAAYPHWATVVEHVGGIRTSAQGELSRLVGAGPQESYGAPLREVAGAEPRVEGKTTVEPAVAGDPVDDPPWHEVLTSSLLLFRRYERGRAVSESSLGWDDRVARLRDLYAHHAGFHDDVPSFVWSTLVRDALFVPRSAGYHAVSELIGDDVAALAPAERDAAVGRAAARFGVDEELIRPAVDVPTLASR